MISSSTHLEALNSPVRHIIAKVELYEGSTLVNTFAYSDALKSLTIERVGEDSLFFGFGVCQKINVKLRDKDKQIQTTTAQSFKVYFAYENGEYIRTTPTFHITETHRDEITNELSITAYDLIYKSNKHIVEELDLAATTTIVSETTGDDIEIIKPSYTVSGFVDACSTLIGTNGVKIIGLATDETCFDTYYDEGANFDGTETVRDALDMVAEATQTVYYVDVDDALVFRRLDKDGEPVYTIDKSKYFSLKSGDNKRLKRIHNVTELGDDVYAEIEASGSTQFVRDNAFWDINEDVHVLLDAAIAVYGGMTINQFECNWRGCYLLEVGDKVGVVNKEGVTDHSYILDDVIEYDGTFKQKSQWNFTKSDAEGVNNPSSLGDTLKQTFARVDKINHEITLQGQQIEINAGNIAGIIVNQESITNTVTNIQNNLDGALDNIYGDIDSLTEQVQMAMTSQELLIQIQQIIENGLGSITTSTGFTFDENGLTIAKTGSEMKTTITEDGMTIYKNDEEVLTADNEGVKAYNLHATTYLIIGNNSRFEDYIKDGEDRTGCFWIGASKGE